MTKGDFNDRLNKRNWRKRSKSKRTGDSKSYLAALHSLPCSGCLHNTVQVHHLRSSSFGRGMGLKSLDRYGIPLCFSCHNAIHLHGSRVEAEVILDLWGFDGMLLANALWECWSEHEDVERLRETFYGFETL